MIQNNNIVIIVEESDRHINLYTHTIEYSYSSCKSRYMDPIFQMENIKRNLEAMYPMSNRFMRHWESYQWISWRQSIDVRPLNSFMTSSTGVSSNPGIIWLYGYKCRTVTSYKILAVSDFLFGYSVIRRDYRYFIGISNSVSVFDSMNLLAAWSIYVPGSIGRFKIRNILVQGILRKCF